jgi:hypothetical protein
MRVLTIGLIRQYIPEKQPFANCDDDFIKNVQHKINRRPRKNLTLMRLRIFSLVQLHLLLESAFLSFCFIYFFI